MINKFACFNGDIASILNITTKHVKNSILRQVSKSPEDQDNLLEQLDFLVRCPACGVGIADHFEKIYYDFKKGKSISEDFALDTFPLPRYADQVIELKQKVREKEITIKTLKAKKSNK